MPLAVVVSMLLSCKFTSYDQLVSEEANSGQSIHVYVIDSHVDFMHPNLVGIAFSRIDFRDRPTPFGVNDTHHLSHGTSTALAVVAGSTHARAGEIMLNSLVVADDNSVDTSAAARALQFVAESKENSVVNLSLGSLGPPPIEFAESLQDLADRNNVIVVIAAGNQATDLDARDSLCGTEGRNVLCVGALGHDRSLTNASNFGQTVDIASEGTLIAPALVGLIGKESRIHSRTRIDYYLPTDFHGYRELEQCQFSITAEEVDAWFYVEQEGTIIWQERMAYGQNVFRGFTFASNTDNLSIHISDAQDSLNMGEVTCYVLEEPYVEIGGTTSIAAGNISGIAARYWASTPHLSSKELVERLCEIAGQNPIDEVRCGII